MGFASKNSSNTSNTIRFIVFKGTAFQNSCKSLYTNAKQCKMYGNLFVQKEEKFVLK